MSHLKLAFRKAHRWIAQGIDEENILDALATIPGVDPQAVYRLLTGWTVKPMGKESYKWVEPKGRTPAAV